MYNSSLVYDFMYTHLTFFKRKLFFSLFIALGICVGFVFLYFRFSLPFFFSPSRIWKNFYPVIIAFENSKKNSINARELVLSIGKGLQSDGVVSPYSSAVTFYDFSGFKSVVIGDIEGYLDKQDPRYDPYMKKLSNFFRGFSKNKQVYMLYFPVSNVKSSLGLYLRLRGILRKNHWDSDNIFIRVVGFIPLLWLLSVVLFVVFSIFLVKGRGNFKAIDWIFVIVGMLPWAVIAIDGGVGEVLLGIVLFTIFIFSYDGLRKTSGVEHFTVERDNIFFVHNFFHHMIFVGALLLLTVALFLLGIFVFQDMLRVFWAVFLNGIVLLWGWVFYRYRYSERLYLHRIFVPVEILNYDFWKENPGKKNRWYLRGAVVIVILFALPFVSGDIFGDYVIPTPRELSVDKRLPLWGKFETLWKLKGNGEFPDISGYIAHCAYQESLPFGYSGSIDNWYGFVFPYRGKELWVRNFGFDSEKNRVFEKKIMVKRFDENWLRGILLKIKDNSVEKVLMSQGDATIVRYISLGEQPFVRFYPLLWLLVLLILIYYLFFVDLSRAAKISYNLGRLYEES